MQGTNVSRGQRRQSAASHFEVSNSELQVRYRELQAKANPAVAAILILEHFVPEAASRADVPIESIQLEDIDTKRIRHFQWSSARK
jgi:hypothetical protein